MQNRNLLIGGVIGLVLILGLGFFLLSQNKAIAPTVSVSPIPTSTSEASASPSASPSTLASPSAMEQKEQTVALTSTGFNPQSITVKKGTTVKWVNKSGEEGNVSSDPHPIHTNYSPLNLGSFADGDSVSLTFDKAGTYGYHDHLNPQLKGTVIVE